MSRHPVYQYTTPRKSRHHLRIDQPRLGCLDSTLTPEGDMEFTVENEAEAWRIRRLYHWFAVSSIHLWQDLHSLLV